MYRIIVPKSTKNVLRGLHFQKTKPQGKLVSSNPGAVFLMLPLISVQSH
ncbi:MAG: dTDP-4-dehydrorhamnose 3,5-epimerase family protein [Escherichia coli]